MGLESERMFEAMRRFKQLNLVEKLGLNSQSEMMILGMIRRAAEDGTGERSVSELAAHMRVSQPAVSRTLKRLRERGLVDTRVDGADRRNTYVVLTHAGRQTMRENEQKVNAFTTRVLAHLEPGELEQFYTLFEKICQGIKEEIAQWPDTNGVKAP